MRFFASLLGGLVVVGLLSRWLHTRFARLQFQKRALAADGGAWVIAVVVAAFGGADGGPLDWAGAVQGYTLPAVLLLVVDLYRGRATAEQAAPAP